MKKILLFIFFSFSIFNHYNYAQTKYPTLIQQNLENYILHQYPEKAYVQTDKPIYTTGEDIWFSAYLLNGITHRKTPKSRILYVELINPENKIVDQKKLYVNDVSVAGDFKINENWPQGNYTLRAYTNYMRNDSISFFQKNITIFNINKNNTDNKQNISKSVKLTNNTKQSQPKPEVTFYPEGGYLVTGIPSRVAFKTKEKNNFTATLKDNHENEIATINSIDLGLGVFSITPENDKTYHISTQINGKKIKYNLPKALPKGYVLNTTTRKNNIIVNINSNTKNGLQNCYLIAHQRGILFHQDYETENIKNKTISIPTNYLSDGVVNITLFNGDGNPVAERVVFVNNPNNNLKLSINTDQNTYKSRQKVIVDINLTNNNNFTEAATLSMAVRDLKAYPYNTRTNNIKTYLLLNSDLRGKIENPGYFFENENDTKRKYLLDLVMMTNGWKRFTWQKILNQNQKELKYKPETALYISGTTTKLKDSTKTHISEVKLTFLGNVLKQEPKQKTDSLGSFTFGPYTFMDSIPSIIEARYDFFGSMSLKTKNVKIILDKPKTPAPIVNKKEFTPTHTTLQDSNFVKVTQYIQQVKFEYNQEVERLRAVELNANKATAAEKRIKEMEDRTYYGKQISKNNRIDVANLEFTPTTIIEVLNTNASHIVREELNNFHWNRDNSVALIFLDGRLIDMNYLRGITCDEISFVDILTGPEANIFTGQNPGYSFAAILLYSKKPHEYKKSSNPKPGTLNFYAKGFYTAREFASPDYVKNSNNFKQTDARTTLHWEPIIKITEEQKNKTSFFTSDVKSDYIIEIEGISAKGQPIHAIQTFNVE